MFYVLPLHEPALLVLLLCPARLLLVSREEGGNSRIKLNRGEAVVED
jgi:hypothetical protein